jgi:hypothetical protein
VTLADQTHSATTPVHMLAFSPAGQIGGPYGTQLRRTTRFEDNPIAFAGRVVEPASGIASSPTVDHTSQLSDVGGRVHIDPEPVKRSETLSYDAFCASSSSVTGSLIHAMVGSLGGSGLRWRNRAGLRA